MKNMIASYTFWCRRSSDFFEVEAGVGAPYLNGELWCCQWTVGSLYSGEMLPAKGDTSMCALGVALLAISTFLHTRQDAGDEFFNDNTGRELIKDKDLDVIFPRVRLNVPR